MNTDFNWITNHEERIIDLERWKENHDAAFAKRIDEFTDMKYAMTSFKEHMNDQKAQNEKTNKKLNDVGNSLTKIIISTLTTICLILLKFVFDIISKKL